MGQFDWAHITLSLEGEGGGALHFGNRKISTSGDVITIARKVNIKLVSNRFIF